MQQLLLNGEWVVDGGDFTDVKAEVPGCIHTDLLNNNLIEDPFYRDNESKYMYIGETDWHYTRKFEVGGAFLSQEHIVLKCHGLDTLATVKVNDEEIATTDNMFRVWEFDVKPFLKEGTNNISIYFHSTYPYMEEKLRERYLDISDAGLTRIRGGNYVRKMQCNYGWDWGPMCVTAGIWKDIEMIGYNDTRIDHVQVKQEHFEDRVELQVITRLTETPEATDLELMIGVSIEGEEIYKMTIPATAILSEHKVVIKDPKKWWPNNLGEQHLYNLEVTVLKGEEALDLKTERIGLRTLFLDRHPDEFGETFQFVVNDIPFFGKGANWIPIDVFVTRASKEFYRQLLVDAKEANMNFIRVWGGGIYELDYFYELCDELGLCVWQDFMFACSAYPVYDEAFMATIKEEFRDNIIRIRNHPCLALWCGNNEIEYMGSLVSQDGSYGTMTWDEYRLLFDELIRDYVMEYDGQHSYWASSPMDGEGEFRGDGSDPTRGDAHLWAVWHGLEPFEWYRDCDHRFNSEFGFQSFPEPEVVNGYTIEEDRNITSYVMEKHQRSGIGNASILHYMLSWFKLPTSFDKLMWTSQILQSLAIKYAVENWRRKMPQGMGTIYWQLNDCWPVASWSSIDSIGNFKALHYSAKKFFNPILISGIEDKDQDQLELFLSNDTLEDIKGSIKWRVFRLDGSLLESGVIEANILANSAAKQAVLELKDVFDGEEGARACVVAYAFEVAGKVVSENTTLFRYPKHLKLEQPTFDVNCSQLEANSFKVRITTDKPSLWVWMDLGECRAKYSDRFFDLYPGDQKEIVITTQEAFSLEEFEKALGIYSIYDSYQ